MQIRFWLSIGFVREQHAAVIAGNCILRGVLFFLLGSFLVLSPLRMSGREDLRWERLGAHRVAELRLPDSTPTPTPARAGFEAVDPDHSRVVFTNTLTAASMRKNRVLENGSGIAAGDVDGDGWCDLYFCRLDGDNVLYRNLGDWRFSEVPDAGGAACPGQFSNGACFADLDGDADLDLLVNSVGGGTRRFLNDGTGRFDERTQDSGLANRFGAHSLALADVDNDGDLDLYVVNNRASILKDADDSAMFQLRMVNGQPQAPPRYRDRYAPMRIDGILTLVEFGEHDLFYENRGDGSFETVSWTSGRFLDAAGNRLREPYREWGLAAMFRDMTGDGAPDLYVCNDHFSPDRIWVNDGQGGFQEMPPLAIRKTSHASMAVDFADVNRDGHDDFVVVDMLSRRHLDRQFQRSNHELAYIPWWGWPLDADRPDSRWQMLRNTLFLNRGNSTWSEIAWFSGVQASEWSWGAVFLDVDLDGFEDLLIANGHGHDLSDTDAAARQSEYARQNALQAEFHDLAMFPGLDVGNAAFRNRDGLRFDDVSSAWGFDEVGVSNGMALADLDNDGDMDVVLNNLNGRASLLRNTATAPRIGVRLRGRAPNTRGIGARIRVTGGPMPQSQEMICGGRYLSADEAQRVFAARSANQEDLVIEVTWRDGTQTTIKQVRANRIYEIYKDPSETGIDPAQGTASDVAGVVSAPADVPVSAEGGVFFEDASAWLGHRHEDTAHNDWARQPLLPWKRSRFGPGAAWHDLNGDGWDDLLVGAGRGSVPGVFLSDRRGRFKGLRVPIWMKPVGADIHHTLVWAPDGVGSRILFGHSSFETGLDRDQGRDRDPTVAQYQMSFSGVETLPEIREPDLNVGAMALGDYDGDDDLDLFVGGNAVPGEYPLATPSRVFRNDKGRFVLDEANSRSVSGAGLVNGAVFSDLDGDGFCELLLATEWGPIRVYQNRRGRFDEQTGAAGLNGYLGWWNGVNTGDFDGDGRLDIVATNWGRNTRYEPFLAGGIRLYHGDFDGNGTRDLIEAGIGDASVSGAEVALRDFKTMRLAMPFLAERIGGYREFGRSTVRDLLAGREPGTALRVNTLDSMLFLQRDGFRFETRSLPVQAQFTPGFDVRVADWNGDGREDLFVSQNFFGADRETGRYDDGLGLCLRGDGHGNFEAVSSAVSGVEIHGEQRGAAFADFNADGRVDLLVTQHSDSTRLFVNRGARPGLRVRLRGPIGNVSGLGATVQLNYRRGRGPLREIHAGAGSGSQDSPVTVFSVHPEFPTSIEVRWPGGRITRAAIPVDAREISVDVAGRVRTL